jgi:hypothetical protein
MLESVGNR